MTEPIAARPSVLPAPKPTPCNMDDAIMPTNEPPVDEFDVAGGGADVRAGGGADDDRRGGGADRRRAMDAIGESNNGEGGEGEEGTGARAERKSFAERRLETTRPR